MKVIKILGEKLNQNNYLVVSDDNLNAVLIDASAKVSMIEENLSLKLPKAKINAIFLTHSHFDHIQELENLSNEYDCPVYIYKDGKDNLFDINKNLSVLDEPIILKKKRFVKIFKEGQKFQFGQLNVECFFTPGHSNDSSMIKIEDGIDSNLFTGDTIFKNGVGRTDLYGGDFNLLKISLERLLATNGFGCDVFYPGHGVNFDKSELKYIIDECVGDIY